jgi:holliday junction DNA helicase RuvB
MSESADVFRATSWSAYVGQQELKDRLDVHINAAVREHRYLDHVLLTGPPGAGKTTMAGIIAGRLQDPLLSLVCPIKPAIFAGMLRQWAGGILFLDEIHRCSKGQQEDLLQLLEDFRYQPAIGAAIEWTHLTVIGATTEPESVIAPLWDRFPIKPVIASYSDEEMSAIVGGMAERVGMEFPQVMCMTLGRATGGIPRNARQFVLAARDIGEGATAQDVLKLCGTDEDGLNGNHVRYLEVLAGNGGKAGLSMLASHLRLHAAVIRELERLLVQRKLLSYGDRGRELTRDGWAKVRGNQQTFRRVA